MAGGFLRAPRVRVLWGKMNLSAYDGAKYGAPEVFSNDSEKGGPIVFDVQVDLNAEGNGPTASMKWDPTAPAFAVYEWLITNPEYMKTQITIEYFYPRGKRIVFAFVWSGQSINYGNDMSITVKMVSELAGLINANPRSTAQAYDEKKGTAALDVYNRTQQQFGLDGFPKLVQFSPASLEYAKKAKIANAYGSDVTFGGTIANLAKQTGDSVTGVNIGTEASVVVFSPYSYKGKGSKGEEVINAFSVKAGELPNPARRYGFILGPAIIDSIQRSSEWKPPQQNNSNTPTTQTKVTNTAAAGNTNQSPPTAPQLAQEKAAAKRTSSPIGTSGNRASVGISSANNPEAPDRQNALNDEKGSKLSMQTFMCPLLVGIKPNDILFVPSFNGKFIEDWVVQSVSYNQSNGAVELSLEATRVLGLGTPMNETEAKKYKAFAEQQGLIGANASLEAWDAYAWSLPGS